MEDDSRTTKKRKANKRTLRDSSSLKLGKDVLQSSTQEVPVKRLREENDYPLPLRVEDWTVEDVGRWLRKEDSKFSDYAKLFEEERIDGRVLLNLSEQELREHFLPKIRLGDAKKIFMAITNLKNTSCDQVIETWTGSSLQCLPRLAMSMGYALLVLFITAVTMTFVHERVPDPKAFPPLPDIFLDNIPHMPFAFQLAELIGVTMFIIFVGVLAFHKHRVVVTWRVLAILGTVFLLRCVTMFVTSLSVPGTHLKCSGSEAGITIEDKLWRAWEITRGLGMSINGVRTCGDYMFSGHTIVLTMLNYSITEYTPENWVGLHYFTHVLNIFGMFFILAAHEHYSIDVFVAFYITSRLFLYYHSLANSAALRHHKIKPLFPVFSYLEENTQGMVVNEYEWPWEIVKRWWALLKATIAIRNNSPANSKKQR